MKLSKDKLFQILDSPELDHKKENIICKCPWCSYREFGISLEDNHLFGCFRKKKCGVTGNIYKLLKKIKRNDLIEGQEKVDFSNSLETTLNKNEEESDKETEIPDVSPPIGFKRTFNNEYLNSRGFDKYEKYEVGTTSLIRKLRGYIIVLVKENGKVKGYIGRATKDGLEPKYSNSSSDFGKLVFGIDEITNKTEIVILTEGIFDKFNIDKLLNLDEDESIKCCSGFGGKFSIHQIKKLNRKGKNIKNIILLFDPDIINVIKKVSFDLEKYWNVKIAHIPFVDDKGNTKDAGILNLNELNHTLDKLETPLSYFRGKVQPLL